MADPYHPNTFPDRGVAVPFTTPMLAGARLRDTGRHGKELLVHNPSGGRGMYIIPIRGVREQYRPTVHDVMLLRRIEAMGPLTPGMIREAAWTVARDGYAGAAARGAAEAALQADRRQAMMAEVHLLHTLVEQVEPGGEPIEDLGAWMAELRRRGRGVLTRLSRSLGRSGQELGQALAALAALFAPVGVHRESGPSRLARQIGRVQQARDEVLDTFAHGDSGAGALARAIVTSADIVLPCANATLAAAQAMTADPIALLVRWFSARTEVLGAASRTEWFLDGWEQIALLWRAGGDSQKRLAALFEMAQIIPLLPREAAQWSPRPLPPAALAPNVRVASHNDDWRVGGSALLLIDRNERMRAMSL